MKTNSIQFSTAKPLQQFSQVKNSFHYMYMRMR